MVQVLYVQFLLWTLVLGFSPSPNSAGPEENCRQCHSKILDLPYVHYPASESCLQCHATTGNPHPKPGTTGFSLRLNGAELCYECHSPMNSKANLHSPAGEGQCSACHSPHASSLRYLLKATTPSSLCKSCHSSGTDTSGVIHKPFAEGNCMECHDPHQSDLSGLLKDSVQNLCQGCHDQQKAEISKLVIHDPFAGSCLFCHVGHQSASGKLLSTPTPGLCYNCHTDFLDSYEKARNRHGALESGKSCMNCHSPHSSDTPVLLKQNEITVCLGCHSRTIKTDSVQIENIGLIVKNSLFKHKIIEDVGCSPCHQAHYSESQHLLNEKFPEGPYTDGREDSFTLCFTCHDPRLLEDGKTTSATSFRNGERNLHYLHVNREKGRNCTLCHGIHGSAFVHLISDRVSFGNWDMPIKYLETPSGGTCSPGCHLPKSYSR
jgi:predicted CXXCH cytochrome family protein